MAIGKLKNNYNLEKLHVLVVDDNRFMQLLVVSILNALGVRKVSAASDGTDALEALKTFPADIVICDWLMEPMNGLDFTRAIRNSKSGKNTYIPIIILSSFTDAWRIAAARDAGVNEFLAKPISAKTLYSRISSLINRPRQFVKTNTYFGPDRRRKDEPRLVTIERRKQDFVPPQQPEAAVSTVAL